jgi:hypothetical protein
MGMDWTRTQKCNFGHYRLPSKMAAAQSEIFGYLKEGLIKNFGTWGEK